jgi:hypothetical protein
MTARFVAKLSQAPNLLAFDDGQIAAGNLYEGAGDGAHDESKEERVALLASAVEVSHEGGPMNAWGEWINKIEEKLDDLEKHLTRGDILEAVWTIVVIERR